MRSLVESKFSGDGALGDDLYNVRPDEASHPIPPPGQDFWLITPSATDVWLITPSGVDAWLITT